MACRCVWRSPGRSTRATTEARCSAPPKELHTSVKWLVAFFLSGCVCVCMWMCVYVVGDRCLAPDTQWSWRMFFCGAQMSAARCDWCFFVTPCTSHCPFSITVVLHVCVQTVSPIGVCACLEKSGSQSDPVRVSVQEQVPFGGSDPWETGPNPNP